MPVQTLSRRVHATRLLALGLPLMGTQIAQFAIQLTDTVMLGRYDVTALASQVLSSALFFTLLMFGAGFGWAVMPLVAAAEAKGDATEMRRATRMALWLSAAFAIATLPVFLFAEAILTALGQAPDLAEGAGLYLRIQGWSILPALAVMVLRSTLAGAGQTGPVLVSTLVSVALNAVANLLLIFGAFGAPELGLAGAAIASVLSTTAGAIVLVLYVRARLAERAIFARLWRPDPEALGRVFRLGWPIGITTLAEAGLFQAATLLVGTLGTVPVATHGIALNITSLMFMLHVGLAQAATIRAAEAYGAGHPRDLRRGARMALALSAAFAAVTTILFLGIPETLARAFLAADDPATPAILALAPLLLAAAALFQFADAAQVMALGLLRGVQDTRKPMVLAAISYWILGIPAAWALGLWGGMGAVGVWLGMALGLSVAGATMQWRFWIGRPYANGSEG